MQNDSWFNFPITYFTHKKIDKVNWERKNNSIYFYIDGECIFKIVEPNLNVRGLRASIGIYDNTLSDKELNEYIKSRCGNIIKRGSQVSEELV